MFERGAIKVDASFVRFADKSYAINKINSVDVRSETKRGSFAYVIWWILALIFAVPALVPGARGMLIIVAVFAVLGWRSWSRRRRVTTYALFLVTSSGEAQAYETSDAEEMAQLRSAVEDAIAAFR